MRQRCGLIGITLASFLTAGSALAREPLDQAGLDRLAAEIGYQVAIVDNRPACPDGLEGCFLSTITLTVPERLPHAVTGDLSIYFSFVSRLPRVDSDQFDHALINGDLQRLTLKPGARLEPGQTYEIKLWGAGNNFSRAFVMPNVYLVSDGLAARTIAATLPSVDPDTGLETVSFVAPMLDEARLATSSPDDRTQWLTPERAFDRYAARPIAPTADIAILPLPANVELLAGEPLDVTGGIALSLDGVDRAALGPALDALAGAGLAEGGSTPLTIQVRPDASATPGQYALNIGEGRIAITAADADGARFALRSLAQQAAFDQGRVRPLRVSDRPAYPFRGLHLDLGRNFHDRDQILKLVEAMAAFKMNRLHLHLVEDEGWRIEIPALPELASIGSRRCHDPAETRCLQPQLGAGPDGESGVNGYLSEADYIAIVQAATARGIEVIPSIDMPGHSRAAIVSMEARHARLSAEGRTEEADQYRLIDPADTTVYRSIQNYDDNTLNVCIPATYRFIDTVVESIAAMHQRAGAPLKTFHLGADETAGAWVHSPACAAMIAENGGDSRQLTPRFIERVSADLAAKGIQAGGWSDGMGHTDAARMPTNAQTNIWGMLHNSAIPESHDQLNRGWDVVLSIPDLGYFDMPYAPHPEEGGYDWASRGVETRQVFAFMPDNLPANAALITDTYARSRPIADTPQLETGRRIAGVQAQLWSETVRTDANVDYMLFPRLLAMAERGWSPTPWAPPYQAGATYEWRDPRVNLTELDTAWSGFAGRVAAQFPMLDRMGVAYRVSPPGARIQDGRLEANTEFPGTAVEYRSSGGAWTPYTGPVNIDGPVDVRARSADGRRASRVVTVTAASE